MNGSFGAARGKFSLFEIFAFIEWTLVSTRKRVHDKMHSLLCMLHSYCKHMAAIDNPNYMKGPRVVALFFFLLQKTIGTYEQLYAKITLINITGN